MKTCHILTRIRFELKRERESRAPFLPSFLVSCMQTFGFEAILLHVLLLLRLHCGRDQRIVMVSGRGHPARPARPPVRLTVFCMPAAALGQDDLFCTCLRLMPLAPDGRGRGPRGRRSRSLSMACGWRLIFAAGQFQMGPKNLQKVGRVAYSRSLNHLNVRGRL